MINTPQLKIGSTAITNINTDLLFKNCLYTYKWSSLSGYPHASILGHVQI